LLIIINTKQVPHGSVWGKFCLRIEQNVSGLPPTMCYPPLSGCSAGQAYPLFRRAIVFGNYQSKSLREKKNEK